METYRFQDKKILIIEKKPENIVAAKEAYKKANLEFVDNLEEATEKLKDECNYDAVISALYLNDSENPEGVAIGKKCLENKIHFAILANGEKDKIRKIRAKYFNNKELMNLVGKEDPLKDFFVPLDNLNKTNPYSWEWAYDWSQYN